MQGRALDRQGSPWTFLVAVFGAVPADAFLPDHRAAYYVCGLSAGAAWQLLHRRDLTSRLTLGAMLMAIGLTVTLVRGQPFEWDDMNTRGLYWIALLLGLIFSEQLLRARDRRAREPQVTPVQL